MKRQPALPRIITLLSGLVLLGAAIGRASGVSLTLINGGRFQTPLSAGSDGNLYACSQYSGTNGTGTVYCLSPTTGQITELHSFASGNGGYQYNADGINPTAAPIQGSDGNLYGVAAAGGPFGAGTVFKVTPGGVFTLLHVFTSPDSHGFNADGAYPSAAPVLGPDGSVYGTTPEGGAHGTGTVFRITPSGVFSVIYPFQALSTSGTNTNGASPEGLVLGPDGNVYGTTRTGGTNGIGTFFRVTPGAVFTRITSYSSVGVYSLMLGRDGAFYGQALTSSELIIGRVTLSGAISTFGRPGVGVLAALGPDGTFYLIGSTSVGGEIGYLFSIFQVWPDGALHTLVIGLQSVQIVVGADGYLYEAGFFGLYRVNQVKPDFNSDGYPDLLWQNTSTGKVVYTLMNGVQPVSWADLYASSDTNWKIVAVTDDSSPLFVWQNSVTGSFMYLSPSGGTTPSGPGPPTGMDPNFKLVGVPDLNADGTPDRLWQNAVTGELVIELMDPYESALGWADIVKKLDPNWKIVGTPDLNNDGYPDLLWQNIATGEVVYTLMNGITPMQWGTLFKGVDPDFQIVGTPDFNRDGHPDILWQNQKNGKVVYTLMNGLLPIKWGDIFQSFDTHWKLMGTR